MNLIQKTRLLFGKIFKKCSDILMAEIYRYELFKDTCRNLGYKVTETKDNKISLVFPSGNTVYLRKNTSDIDVFKQVLIEGEYQPIIDIILKNKIEIYNIIDCGANIGLASMFFHDIFPKAKIFAVEADHNNFRILEQNLQKNKAFKLLHNAIWHQNITLVLDRSFRDKKEWSVSVKEPENTGEEITVEAITINNILTTENLVNLDLLKVDIEGAEKEIFTRPETCTFLNKTKVLAIELHKEFGISDQVNAVLKHYGFVSILVNETTFAIKKELLL